MRKTREQIKDSVPPVTLQTLQDYVEHGLMPGGFVTAVLEHDLFAAVNNADEENSAALVDIVRYIWNELPMECHGQRGVVEKWMRKVRKNR